MSQVRQDAKKSVKASPAVHTTGGSQSSQKKKKPKKHRNMRLNGRSLIDSMTLQRKLSKLIFDLKKSKVAVDKLSSLLVVDPELRGVQISARDIPFDIANFFKGTQNPSFRLYIAISNVVLVTSSVYNTVFVIEGSSLGNFTDFPAIFDEYRVIVGEVWYMHKGCDMTTSTGTARVGSGHGCAVIDYDESTALASDAAAALFDTRKFVNFVSNYHSEGNAEKHKIVWPLKFEKLPDQEWIDTATGTTDFAYWKPYIVAAEVNVGGTYGVLTGWVDVQYRSEH